MFMSVLTVYYLFHKRLKFYVLAILEQTLYNTAIYLKFHHHQNKIYCLLNSYGFILFTMLQNSLSPPHSERFEMLAN